MVERVVFYHHPIEQYAARLNERPALQRVAA